MKRPYTTVAQRGTLNSLAKVWNIFVALLLVIAVLFRVRGDISRDLGGLALFTLSLAWSLLPYLLQTWVHKHASASPAVTMLAVLCSLVVSLLGLYFIADAWIINFSPQSSGLTLFFVPLYQLPMCLPSFVAVLVLLRAKGSPERIS